MQCGQHLYSVFINSGPRNSQAWAIVQSVIRCLKMHPLLKSTRCQNDCFWQLLHPLKKTSPQVSFPDYKQNVTGTSLYWPHTEKKLACAQYLDGQQEFRQEKRNILIVSPFRRLDKWWQKWFAKCVWHFMGSRHSSYVPHTHSVRLSTPIFSFDIIAFGL